MAVLLIEVGECSEVGTIKASKKIRWKQIIDQGTQTLKVFWKQTHYFNVHKPTKPSESVWKYLRTNKTS